MAMNRISVGGKSETMPPVPTKLTGNAYRTGHCGVTVNDKFDA